MYAILVGVAVVIFALLFSVLIPLLNYLFSTDSFGLFEPVYDVLCFLIGSDGYNALMSLVVLCVVGAIFHWCLKFIKGF